MSERIRTIKPEWRKNEKLQRSGDAARVLSAALITLADDFGNGRAGIGYIAGETWGTELEDSPRETLAKARETLARLSADGYCTLYEVGGQRYFHLNQWTEHQRVDRPSKKGKCPDFSEDLAILATPSRDSRETLATDRDLDQDLNRDLDHTRRVSGPVDTGTADAVARVFGEWVRAFGLSPARTKLTPKRSRAIKARLAEFTADELCALIALRAADPWRREDPVRFELATLLRNHEGVELALSKAPAPDTPNKFGPPNMHDTSDLGDLLEFRKPKVIHG